MRSTFIVPVDPGGAQPLFVQIAGGVVDAIRRGRLAPGARLPGSRALAASLAVHRNTVLAAFDELAAQGWIVKHRGKGTFVSSALPESKPRRFVEGRTGMPDRPGYPLRATTPSAAASDPLPRGVLSLASGVPDLRLAPVDDLARAYRRAVHQPGGHVLGYGFERGHPRLRAGLAAMLNDARGLSASADDVFVTRGSQMAFYLVARALVEPGDVVAVEALGYSPAWDAFRAAGAEIVAIPVDEHGLVVDELRALAARRPVRAVYTTPHHQFPTLAVLSAERRLALLDLARTHSFAIVEDDYDNELHYHGRPVLPLASADHSGNVVYVCSLSKVLAPGVRVGYIVAPALLLDKMAGLRRVIDRQDDPAIELAVAELLEDGVIQRHTRRMRRIFQSRRDKVIEQLRLRVGDVLSFDVPAGGLALWAKIAAHVNVDVWCARALTAGVAVRPPSEFAVDGRTRPFLRLGFAPLDEGEIVEAVARLAKALPHALRDGITAPSRKTRAG